MEEEQCMLELSEQTNIEEGCLEEVVELHPIGEHCYVNETICEDSVKLTHGAIVQFGTVHLLRFNNPVASAQMRARGVDLQLRPARLVGGAAYEEEAKLKAEDAAMKQEKAIMDLERKELMKQREQADAEKALMAEQTLLAKEKAIEEHAKLADEAKRAKAKEAENDKLRLEIEQMKIMAAKDVARRKREDEKHDAEIATKAVAEAKRQQAQDANKQSSLELEKALLEQEVRCSSLSSSQAPLATNPCTG
jgi:hypothetical protein